jgi:hypothetical protein
MQGQYVFLDEFRFVEGSDLYVATKGDSDEDLGVMKRIAFNVTMRVIEVDYEKGTMILPIECVTRMTVKKNDL